MNLNFKLHLEVRTFNKVKKKTISHKLEHELKTICLLLLACQILCTNKKLENKFGYGQFIFRQKKVF